MGGMIIFKFVICFIAGTGSFVVITGFTMNLMPSSRVMNTEKLPIVVLGTRLAIQLPNLGTCDRDGSIIYEPFWGRRVLNGRNDHF